MAKIAEEISRKAYEVAKEVYRGELSKKAACKKLAVAGMNTGSANDYINNLKYMLEGTRYARTLNIYTTKYILENISIDFGEQALLNALSALEQHLDYYDSLRHGRHVTLRKVLKEYLTEIQSDHVHPEEVDSEESLFEGAKKQVTVNVYERNAVARGNCISKYGYICQVCAFDFENVYGDIGWNFIHVHHLVELSTIDAEYIVDGFRDLRPVCPNCHAMLHKKKPAYSIEELKELLKKR